MAMKKSRGCQKIDIVKIENKQTLQVTFSKGRSGLFKKASDLCTLTGSEVVLVVFSPSEKAYAFSSPSVNDIIEKFKSRAPHLTSIDLSNLFSQANHKANVQHLHDKITILENQLDGERKRGKILDHWRKIGQSRNWWEDPIDEFNLDQLVQYRLALLVLQNKVKAEMNRIVSENATKYPIHQGISPYGMGPFDVNNVRENVPSFYDHLQPKSTGIMASSLITGPLGFAGISMEDETQFSTMVKVHTASVPYDVNGPRFHAGSIVPPYPQGFNYSNGSRGLLTLDLDYPYFLDSSN